MKRNLKRMMCLVLVLLMLPTTSLAATYGVTPSGDDVTSSGTSPSGWGSGGSVGFQLSVESTAFEVNSNINKDTLDNLLQAVVQPPTANLSGPTGDGDCPAPAGAFILPSGAQCSRYNNSFFYRTGKNLMVNIDSRARSPKYNSASGIEATFTNTGNVILRQILPSGLLKNGVAQKDVIEKQWTPSMSEDTAWSLLLALCPMNASHGIGGTTSSIPDATLVSYLNAPANSFNAWLANDGTVDLYGTIQTGTMLKYFTLLLAVATASQQPEMVTNIQAEMKKFMLAEPYKFYLIALQPVAASSDSAGNGAGVLSAVTYLRLREKTVDQAPSTNHDTTYAAWANNTGTTGALGALLGASKQSGAPYGSLYSYNGAVRNNPAYRMTSIDPVTMVAFAQGLQVDIAGSSSGGTYTLDKYIVPRGYGYLLSSALRLDMGTIIVIDPSKTGVGTVTKGEDIIAYTQSGISMQPKTAAIANGGSYTQNVDVVMTWDLEAEWGVNSGLTLSKLENQPTLLDVIRVMHDKTVNTSTASQSAYSAMYSKVQQYGSVSGIPSTLKPYKYSENPTLALTFYAYIFQDSEVSADEVATLEEASRMYWGTGGDHATSALNYNWVGGYAPNNNPLDKKVREAPKIPFGGQLAQAFAHKYKESECGFKFEVSNGGEGFTVTLTDPVKAWNYFGNGRSSTLTVTIPYTVQGTVETGNVEKSTWAYIGGGSSLNQKSFPADTSVNLKYEVKETKTETMYADDGTPIVLSTQTVVKESGDRTFPNITMTGLWIRNLCDLKNSGSPVQGIDEEKPTYHSVVNPKPHTEFNQGTIPNNATGPKSAFNSMTGTPTFTATEANPALNGSLYSGKDGHYYQYFAAGGSEFVVEFDGEYQSNKTATRTYEWQFAGGGVCDKSTDSYDCNETNHPEYDDEGALTGYGSCDDTCEHAIHCSDHPHVIGNVTQSATVTYTGLSYIEIKNLKVWELSEARLDGTRQLLATDKVTATVQSTAPGVSYNIAGANTAAAGRMVYAYEPTQLDKVVFKHSLSNKCGNDAKEMQDFMKADVAKIKLGAWCVSDFIVLHTSNGDQSICYYEYKDKNFSQQAAATISATSSSPAFGTSYGSASISFTNANQQFEVKTYEEIWKNNKETSEGCALPDDGITYGGYNGDYMSASTKYKSSGYAPNMTRWSATQAYLNTSRVYGSKANSGLYKAKVSKSFRLMNDTLVIPDTRVNGLYEFTESSVFYRQIINFKSGSKTYPTGYASRTQSDYGGKKGFVLTAGYGSNEYEDVCNGIVVYNPVSNEDAILISLPAERDQRSAQSTLPDRTISYACPGDETCDHQEIICDRTDHMHSESCYTVMEYVSHSGYNVHEHTDACTYHYSGTNTTGWRHIHCINGCQAFEGYCTGNRATCSLCRNNVPFDNGTYPNDSQYQAGGGYYLWYHTAGCSYAGQTHNSTSSTTCTQCNHNCGYLAGSGGEKVYDCGDLPLNAHKCTGASGGGDMETGQSKTFSYTGSVQSVKLAPGTYKLETWGAQGGGYNSYTGGPGGYSSGNITLTSQTTVYVYVGQQGTSNSSSSMMFGGGGYSGIGGAGGGATDMRIGGTALGNRVIVAGGGGGADGSGSGGSGGGTSGTRGSVVDGLGGGGPGTQTSRGVDASAYLTNSPAQNEGGAGRVADLGGGGGGYFGGGLAGNSGGGGGSGYIGGVTGGSTTAGVRYGTGQAKITAVAVTPTATCVETTSVMFSCADPHHTWNSNWKLYTYGTYHTDGTVCKGRACTNTKPFQLSGGREMTIAEAQSSALVLHTNGTAHISSTTNGICSWCTRSYSKVLFSSVTSNDRSLSAQTIAAETTHYKYGDTRCYKACGNSANHSTVYSQVEANGTNIKQGTFVNLDWGFTIYFPNNGDFYGTGRAASGYCSAERGKGYVDNMDTTEWIAYKWVIFPFDVVHKGISYPAGQRIMLYVPDTMFDFYVPMENREVAGAEVIFGTTAINDPTKLAVDEARILESTNRRITSNLGHPHDADKRFYVDVVGRIGALTMNDVGDFRYSNFFKQTIDGWLVPNVIRKVDSSKQNNILMDTTDIRGVAVTNSSIKENTMESTALGAYTEGTTNVGSNTYGIREERLRKIWSFPLTSSYLASNNAHPGYQGDNGWVDVSNNQAALARQPVRVGYDSYMDFTTLGNYYGTQTVANGDDLQVIPHYFKLDLSTNKLQPVDVYMQDNGTYVLINDADANNIPMNNNTSVSMNWVEEAARRNYTAAEEAATDLVAQAYGFETPHGSKYIYGTYDFLTLTDRNRSSIGTVNTYNVSTDPSEAFTDLYYKAQGARWHFNLGLPSSAVFVYSGQAATKQNIEACSATENAVIVCGLEIFARGDVWNLIYDGKDINSNFKVLPDGTTVSPSSWTNFNYPGRTEDLVLAEIISINHSSKEDVGTTGTN